MEVDLLTVVFGMFSGLMAGVLGIGGGTFMVPFLVLIVGLSQHESEATSLLVILPTSIVATVVLARKGAVDLRQALTVGLIGAVGAIAGAMIALALPASTLRPVFGVFMALVAVRMLWSLRVVDPSAQ